MGIEFMFIVSVLLGTLIAILYFHIYLRARKQQRHTSTEDKPSLIKGFLFLALASVYSALAPLLLIIIYPLYVRSDYFKVGGDFFINMAEALTATPIYLLNFIAIYYFYRWTRT